VPFVRCGFRRGAGTAFRNVRGNWKRMVSASIVALLEEDPKWRIKISEVEAR
jgi:hypothetical protein